MENNISLRILTETEILNDLLRTAKDKGVINQEFEQSRIYIYYSVFARVFGNLSQIFSEYLQSITIDTARDEAVLEQLLKPFIEKRLATVSKTILRFERRDMNESTSDILIPVYTRVYTEQENPIMFQTLETKTLWKDAHYVLVPASSIEYGSKNNVPAGTLTLFDSDLFGEVSVTNIIDCYGGRNEETAFDMRNRLFLFRYGRDGTKSYISNVVMALGIGYAHYSLSEYYDGSGSILIALDVDSVDEYYDIISQIEPQMIQGISIHFAKVNRIYLDLDVQVNITGNSMYDSYDVKNIQQSISDAIKAYFETNIYVGYRLSVKRLEAFILNYLVRQNYEIYEIDVNIAKDNRLILDRETGEVIVEPYEKLYTNKVQSEIIYNKV